MDVEQLITEIEKRPVIWDVSDELYKDRNKKNYGWMEVVTVLFEHFGEKTEAEQKIITIYYKSVIYIMNTNISEIYQQLCLKNHIKAHEFILSSLYNASEHGELNLGNSTISETSCSLIAETLKLIPIIKTLNLSDCLLSVDGLKFFLEVLNKLDNLLLLNLKGNQIGKNLTNYISKILIFNRSIIELRLDWNNIGVSVSAFAQFCNSLILNTVLNTLNLANNNLCQECSIHLAKLISTNRCLKTIDLSWNCLGETGAVLLLKSLKSNEIIIELKIHGNGVCEETSTMIDKHLKQNKLNEVNKKNIQNRNLGLLGHVSTVDENYQTELATYDDQYQNDVDELRLKLQYLETENQKQKQEIKELKSNNLKEKESNVIILNQVEKVKSELSLQNKSLNLLIKKISNEISNSEIQNLESLEDFDKIIYIINQIKKKYNYNCTKEIQLNKQLSESVLKLSNELNVIKSELRNLKSSIEIETKDYSDELEEIKKLFLSNMYYLKMSKTISDEMRMDNSFGQEESNFSDEQTKMLVLLDEQLKTLHKEKIGLEIKLAKLESKSVVDAKTLRALENSLMSAKEELQKFNKKELADNKNAQTSTSQMSINTLTQEIDILKNNLIEKDRKLRYCETERDNMNKSYKMELLTLEKELQSAKQKCAEETKEDHKQIEELYTKFTQYITQLRKKKHDDINY